MLLDSQWLNQQSENVLSLLSMKKSDKNKMFHFSSIHYQTILFYISSTLENGSHKIQKILKREFELKFGRPKKHLEQKYTLSKQ